MNVLELFCGTKSVGKCCDEIGWNVISLDWEKKFNPTHCCDILEFDYKIYPRNYFDIIWASPDCRYYSRLQNTWIGRKNKDGIVVSKELIEENRKKSDILIRKVWEIIDYFDVEYWYLENPLSCLKDREVMKDKPYFIVDYCKYSDFGYRKRTCIWTNKKDFEPLICNKDCENMITIDTNGAVHTGYKTPIKSAVAQHIHPTACGFNHLKGIKHKKDVSDFGGGTNRNQRYRVPADLIYSLFLD